MRICIVSNENLEKLYGFHILKKSVNFFYFLKISQLHLWTSLFSYENSQPIKIPDKIIII